MMTNEEMYLYDYMVETGIATAEELNLARNLVGGSWLEVLNSVLYIRTGYRSLDQLFEAEDEEDEGEDVNALERESLEYTGQWW